MRNKLFTLPNIVTLCNLACGCAAVVFSLGWMRPGLVFWLVAAAAVFDFADGMVARLTGQYSEIGKQLDSLADLVSFGVAPSAALFGAYQFSWSEWLWPAVSPGTSYYLGFGVFSVALFSALRLAKFNVDPDQKEEFTGLPTPAAGLALVALAWMLSRGEIVVLEGMEAVKGTLRFPQEVILAVAVMVSWLLVSPLRMFSLKFKHFAWKGNELRYTFLVACAVLIAVFGIPGVACAVGLYVVMSAVRHFIGMRHAEKND